MGEPASHFIENARFEFGRMKALAEKAIARLSDEEFEKDPGEESNSVKIIVQHVAGNLISRWTDFLTSDGEKPWRNRDSEFESQPVSREELMKKWEEGWQILFSTFDSLNQEDVLKDITIRNEKLTVTQAIIRQLSHYAYHTGQIVFLAKLIRGSSWESLSIPKGKSAGHTQGTYTRKP
jgi:uncharacterized damage-inducible protein DinB